MKSLGQSLGTKRSLTFTSAVLWALVAASVPAHADHEAGHDEVARGGIQALEQRIWDLESRIQALNPSVRAVDCSGESLQDALDSAVPGDRINVTGTCSEQVTVRVGNLTLDGQGSAIIDGSGLGSGPLVQIRAIDVRFRNFTIQNSPNDGIRVHRGGSAIIEGNTVDNSGRFGILVNNSSQARIGPRGSEHPAAGTGAGNLVENSISDGIHVRSNANAGIFHNKIINNGRHGINFGNGSSGDVDANEISGNVNGIQLFDNPAVALSTHPNHHDTNPGLGSIENNKIEENAVGVRCLRGGALRGNLQNFGTGNPGGGDHTDDHDISGSCPNQGSLGF